MTHTGRNTLRSFLENAGDRGHPRPLGDLRGEVIQELLGRVPGSTVKLRAEFSSGDHLTIHREREIRAAGAFKATMQIATDYSARVGVTVRN